MNMESGNIDGEQFTNILLGTERVKMPIFMTTQEFQMGIYSTACPKETCETWRVDFEGSVPSV